MGKQVYVIKHLLWLDGSNKEEINDKKFFNKLKRMSVVVKPLMEKGSGYTVEGFYALITSLENGKKLKELIEKSNYIIELEPPSIEQLDESEKNQ